MYQTIEEQLKESFFNNPEIGEMLKIKEKEILSHETSSFRAAKHVLDKYFNKQEK